MADLKTNYVDDVLDTSVNDKRKYNMIQNADGTVSFVDVTTYTQNGDSFGAKDVNDTNTAVNELNNNQIKYKTLEFDITAESNVPISIYDYSNDEDLKNAEIVGIVSIQANFFTTVSLYNLDINISAKVIYIWVGTGQHISGRYSVLYR